jgi:hypothetical protein
MPRNNRTNRRPQPRRRPANEPVAVDVEVQITPEVGDYVTALDGLEAQAAPAMPDPATLARYAQADADSARRAYEWFSDNHSPVARVHDEYMIPSSAIVVDESSPLPPEAARTFGQELSRRMNNQMFSAIYGANYEQMERIERQALEAERARNQYTAGRAYPTERGTWTFEYEEAEPSNANPVQAVDPFRDPNLSAYLRSAREEQHARIAEQQQQYEQRRHAEAEAARQRAREELRLEQERQENEARNAAMAMRVTLTEEQSAFFADEIVNYYGEGWRVLAAFKMEQMYRRYVGSPSNSEYLCVFVAMDGQVRDNGVQVIIYRKRAGRIGGDRWERQMNERYDHILCTAPSDITRPLKHLYNYATVKGRSLTVTGGQLLMDYALNDRNILAELNKQYHPEIAETARRAQRFNQIIAASAPSFDAEEQDRPRTSRGSAAATAAARHPRRRQPVEA